MKIFLAQKLSYSPSWTGAAKSNRELLQYLSRRGHLCSVLALADTATHFPSRHEWRNESLNPTEEGYSPRTEGFNLQGVQVHQLTDSSQFCGQLLKQVGEFSPDWILISEDPSYLALAAALESMPGRVIYLSHSQATLPFGPECFSPDPLKQQMLQRTAGIIAVSNYLKSYIYKWGGLDSVAVSLPAYGSPPWPHSGSLDNAFITMVNPSAIKGIAIFLELARALPAERFAAVPTWATTAADRVALKQFPNVELLQPTEDIDQIFGQTRIMLMPSLWGEAFGKIVVESMLRGIPVLASNLGGLPEAKLGVDYLLPVEPIARYQTRRDDQMLPVPFVPDQDIRPWLDALKRLLSDRQHYDELSTASREAAENYVSKLSIAPVEEYLENLAAVPAVKQAAYARERDGSSSPLKNLSKERLELLALLLRKNAPQDIKQ
ncbi:MAG: glycosyltransferase family 4 protein [Candidatus Binatia bacterium]